MPLDVHHILLLLLMVVAILLKYFFYQWQSWKEYLPKDRQLPIGK